ncbi:MAG: hypothetical protein ACRCU0_01310 [Candidatus Rhabdochlamydia sp.]
MLGITNFNPIKSINSLIQPLGLAVSSNQQIINKIALASVAMLAISFTLPIVEGGELNKCMVACRGMKSCINHCYKVLANPEINVEAIPESVEAIL